MIKLQNNDILNFNTILEGRMMRIKRRVAEETLWDVLKNYIIRHTNEEGITSNYVPELAFHYHECTESPVPHFMRPILIIIAQGSKFVKSAKMILYTRKAAFLSALLICPLRVVSSRQAEINPICQYQLNLILVL